MKKKLLFVFAALVMIMTGCSKEEMETMNGDEAKSFTVNVNDGVKTRAIINDLTRYVMEVYEGTAATGNPVLHKEQAKGAFENVILKNGQAYTVLFWADYGTPNDNVNGDYNVADLKAAKLGAGKTPSKAAFAGSSKFTVGTDDESTYTSITLSHAVAQVQFIQTDLLTTEDNTLVVTYPESYSLNVDAMKVTKVEGEISHTFHYTGTTAGTLGTSYIIAATTSATQPAKTVMDITASFNNEEAKSITNVPFECNFRTNISGAYSGLSYSTLNVICDDQWKTPDNELTWKNHIKKVKDDAGNGAPLYEIYTVTGLKAFADLINGTETAYEINGIQIPAVATPKQRKSNAILMDNIDLAEVCGKDKGNWEPIGRGYEYYSGTFDGNNKTIKNLYINDIKDYLAEVEYTWNSWGFIGTTQNAHIKNLTVSGNINCDNKGNTYSVTAGGVVGSTLQSTVTNCHSSVDIIIKQASSNEGGGVIAGGVVGGNSSQSTVENCTASSDITTEFNAPEGIYALGSFTGGVVGHSYEANIINCHYQSGSIKALSDNYKVSVGGITGSFRYGMLLGCSNSSPISGKTASSKSSQVNMGGVCGYTDSGDKRSYILACYNTSNITILGGTTKYEVGGILGVAYGGTIMACYTTGTVIDNATSAVSSLKGGIIGELLCGSDPYFVSQCWYTGSITLGTSGVGKINDYSSTTKPILTDCGLAPDNVTLNSKVSGMNAAVKTYNEKAEAGKKCEFSFSSGGAGAPVLRSGAPI